LIRGAGSMSAIEIARQDRNRVTMTAYRDMTRFA
jgi:hypothetical protein